LPRHAKDNVDMPSSAQRPQPVSPRIDDPMALLRACHDKVRHFTRLAQRLQAHVQTKGVDQQAQEAAQAVRRYFMLAAPLHHADEDENLFVALRALGLPELNARIDSLQAEHDALGTRWQAILPWLDQVAAGQAPSGPAPDVDGFAQSYRAHAQAEEDEVYPSAQRLSADTLLALADAMVARRSPAAKAPG
jgi:hemerythrin-like domain-containing protein